MKKFIAGFAVVVSLIIGALAYAGIGPINSVTRMFAAIGTATLPSYSFNGQTNAGMYGESTGLHIGFTADGTSMLAVASSASPNGRGIVLRDIGSIRWSADGNAFEGAGSALFLKKSSAGVLLISADGTTTGGAGVALASFNFANIATFLTGNGIIGYCSDCTIANPCAGAGTGALAKRLNGVNVCN